MTAHSLRCLRVLSLKPYPLRGTGCLRLCIRIAPLAAKRSLSAEDVANETFIVPAEGTNHDVGRFFSRAGIRPKAVLNMGDDYAAAAMVERALGFTILPELMLSAMHLGNVRTVPLEHSEREIGLAMNANYHSPALAAFGAFMPGIYKRRVKTKRHGLLWLRRFYRVMIP